MKNTNLSNNASLFNNIYKLKKTQIDNRKKITFPLNEVENLEWGRGEGYNAYYSYFYRRFTCHILSQLNIQDGHSVLNLGCGRDSCSKNLQNIYSDLSLWSIDISHVMLVQAKYIGSPAKLCRGLAEKLPFPDSCFDRIIARETIEHVINKQDMMNEIARVLKPNGLAIVTTENPESLSPRNIFDTHDLNSVKDHAPSLDVMRLLAKHAGLDLEKYFFDGALYLFLPFTSFIPHDKLAIAAHRFSCLENNLFFSKMFCDQAKYILKKTSSFETNNLPKWVCPHCKSKVAENKNLLTCTSCLENFKMISGIPNFVIQYENDDKPQIKNLNFIQNIEKLKRLESQVNNEYSKWFFNTASKASEQCESNGEIKSIFVNNFFKQFITIGN